MTLTHAVIRQAENGVRGSADGVRIINTDILACEQAVALTSGSSREIDTDALQPDDFFLRESRLIYSTDGVIITGVNNDKYFYISSSSLSHNSNGINIKNWASSSGEIETHLYVADCHIEANSANGIWDQTRSYVTVERSSLIGPSQSGYYSSRHYSADGIPVQLTIRDSYFTGFTSRTVYSWCTHCNTVNWTFHNNRFVEHFHEDLYLHHAGAGSGEFLNLEVVNNTFQGAAYSHAFAVTITTAAQDRFLVENNTFDSTQGGLVVGGDVYSFISASLTNNRFINIGPHVAAIKIRRATVNITGNTFQNCTAPSLIELESGSDHVISENKFINNTMSSKCLLSVRENPYEPYSSIQANRNYWDSQDVSRIKGAICDFFLDSSRARVEMIEFYTSPDMSTTVSHHDDFRYEFRSDLNATVIGGVITSSSTISLDTGFGDKLIVNRSIIVEPGANVDLHSVVMEFAANRGMVVFGKTMYMYFVVALQHFY